MQKISISYIFLSSASAFGGMIFNILWILYLKPLLIEQAWNDKLNLDKTIGISPFSIIGCFMLCLQAIGFFTLILNTFLPTG